MRAVVALNEDGSMAGWFESMALAKQKYGIPRDAIWKSIKTGKSYKGFKWVDKETFDKHYKDCTLHKLSYKRDHQRDSKGRWVKGHTPIRHTDETKKKLAAYAKTQSYKQAHDPHSKWGKGCKKPVWCVNNDKVYESFTEAANDLGLTQHQISSAIYGGYKTKGYKFYKIRK